MEGMCCISLLVTLLPAAVFAAAYYWFRYCADACWSLIWAEWFGASPAGLRRQVAWITGAGSGVGRAVAMELASHGVRLVLSDIDTKAIEDVKYTLIAQDLLVEKDILVLPLDVTAFESHRAALDSVLERFGRLDILVNSAGRSQSAKFQDIEMEVHKAMFDLNVFSHVNLTKTVMPHWLERRTGHVVVLSSCASKIALPDSATYNATKAALHGYFEGLWSETFDKGINVTMVCPGPVATPIRQNCFGGTLAKNECFQPTPNQR
ncbi:unnamed protein product, partial [Ixodes hexagonus]